MLHPIDIVNKNNQPTGELSDPEDANRRGRWHRGIHVVIYTSDNKILVQKRSRFIKKNPGMLDIGVGGYVDSGETPEQAAIREIKEETGITVSPTSLKIIGISRYNHRWKDGRLRKISRHFLYSYTCQLESSQDQTISPQLEEVDWIGFLPRRSVQWLIHRHHLKRLGKLSTTYAYYRWLVDATPMAAQ